jgi:hypothetical protein
MEMFIFVATIAFAFGFVIGGVIISNMANNVFWREQ